MNTTNIPNDANAIIKNLLAQIDELERAKEKLIWRNKNQKREIRNLNKTVMAYAYLNNNFKNYSNYEAAQKKAEVEQRSSVGVIKG